MAEKFPYEDIVNLPPHISKKHPQPTMLERAARFAPFAAITGYEEMVLEEARVTDERIELDEGTKEILNAKLQMAVDFADSEPEITITHFVADKKKAGGAYVKHTGVIKKVDEYEHTVIFMDKTVICIENIFAIDGELYNCLE